MRKNQSKAASHTPLQVSENLSRMADAFEVWWTPRIKAYSSAHDGFPKTLFQNLRRYAVAFKLSSEESIGHDSMLLNITNIKNVIDYISASLATIATCDGSVPDTAIEGDEVSKVINRAHLKTIVARAQESLTYIHQKNHEEMERLKDAEGVIHYPKTTMEQTMQGLVLGNIRGQYIKHLTSLMTALKQPLRITVDEVMKPRGEKHLYRLASDLLNEDAKKQQPPFLSDEDKDKLHQIVRRKMLRSNAVDFLMHIAFSDASAYHHPKSLTDWMVHTVYEQQDPDTHKKFEKANNPQRGR